MFIKRLLLLIVVLSVFDDVFAQLCQGSLGDPVAKITFGTGPNTGAPLSSLVTNYTYLSEVCPNDGFYTIANSTNNCFNNTWITLSEDHTPGDNNGYMMIVNASFAAGDFYVQKVDGLCGGTTYEFAAWMVNVIRASSCGGNSIRPNITFKIETTSGQVLQSYTTGDIPATAFPLWKQYGLFFTTPVNTGSVVVRITNNAAGGCGNDIALDDITFRACGPKVSIKVNGEPVIKNVCTGDTSRLNFESSITGGYNNTVYQWQKSLDSISWTDIPGANRVKYSTPAITTPGNYFYRVQVADGTNISLSSCRVASDLVTVNINSLPGASNTGPACEGADVTLTAIEGAGYLWTGPGGFSSNEQSPVLSNVLVSNSGRYYVTVTSRAGCVNKDSTLVSVNLKPVANAGTAITICEGVGTVLKGSAVNAISYKWIPANWLSDATAPIAFAAPKETILYTLTAVNGVCSDSAAVLVTVLKKPIADAGPDKVITGNQVATLNGQVSGLNLTYSWTPDLYMSSNTVLSPVVSPRTNINYILHVQSNDGCGEDNDTVQVKYYKEIYVPNAFTPGNDGLNDRWKIPALAAFPSAEVTVYNRYGQKVFFNKGYTKQWDGTFMGLPQPSGVYTFIIDVKNGLKKLQGIVTVIR